MAELAAFVYGWAFGLAAVVIWILYGIDTLLQLLRGVQLAFAHLPGFAQHAKGEGEVSGKRQGSSGSSPRPFSSRFDSTTVRDELEGLTGTTKRTTPITATGTCLMSWYGPDGATGAPIECRLSLENNEVTVYQLTRVTDRGSSSTSVGAAGRTVEANRSGAGEKRKDGQRDDGNAIRTATGVTVVEHRKGKVNVLHTTVMELKHFRQKKSAGVPAVATGESRAGGVTGSARHAHTGGGRGGNNDSGSVGSSLGYTHSLVGDPNKDSRRNPGGVAMEVIDRWEETLSDSSVVPANERQSGPGDGAGENMRDSRRSRNGTDGSAAIYSGTNTNMANGADPFSMGRVLIWRTTDGRALLDAGSLTSPVRPNNRGTAGGLDSLPKGRGDAALMGRHRSTDNVLEADGTLSEDSASLIDEGLAIPDDHGGEALGRQGPSSRNRAGQRATMDAMASWSCVIMKFERSRESERWYTLLSGLPEARAWHDFAQTLPNPDTVNTFLSRFFFQNMRLPGLSHMLVSQIRKKLRELPAKKFPRDLGGDLFLDNFLIGTHIPWITEVSDPTVSSNGEVGFDFNLLYKGGEGGLVLFFRLALTYLGIRIPHVVLSVKLLELEATVHVSIGPPPSKKFWIGGHKPPVLRLEVRQGCESGNGVLHRVLTALPDLSGIFTNLIKLYLFSDMVLPYMDDFPLPSAVKSPHVSLVDLRVRTFDWQRAAVISSAPERGGTSPGQTEGFTHASQIPVQPERRNSTEAAETPRTVKLDNADGRHLTKTSLMSSFVSVDGASSSDTAATATASAGKNVVASPGTAALSLDDGSARPSSSAVPQLVALRNGGTTATPTDTHQTVPSYPPNRGTPPLPMRRSSTPLGESRNAQEATKGQRSRAREEAEDGTDRSPATADALSIDRMGSYGGSSPSHSRYGAPPLTDSFYGDLSAAQSDSNDAQSATTGRSGRNPAALRNVKHWLKAKGKDMMRDSVFHSKKRN